MAPRKNSDIESEFERELAESAAELKGESVTITSTAGEVVYPPRTTDIAGKQIMTLAEAMKFDKTDDMEKFSAARQIVDNHFRDVNRNPQDPQKIKLFEVEDIDAKGQKVLTKVEAYDEIDALARANDARKTSKGPAGRIVRLVSSSAS